MVKGRDKNNLIRNMKKIFLISCVKKKQNSPCPAKLLYTSPLFKKMYGYAEKHGDEIYVLSAKHGFTHPDKVIEPYNDTLNKKSKSERQQWAVDTSKSIFTTYNNPQDVQFYILGGKNYYMALETLLKEKGYTVEVPMKGLSIGRMLHWLNSNS